MDSGFQSLLELVDTNGSNLFLQIVLQHITDIVLLLDKEKNIVELNAAAELFFDCNRQDALGKNYNDFCSASKEKKEVTARKNHHSVDDSEDEERVEWSSSDLIGVNNEIIGYIFFGKDKSYKLLIKELEKKIQSYLEHISSCMPGNFYWKDLEGRYLGCNDSLIKTLGLSSKSQIVGKTDYDIWPEQADQVRNNDRLVMNSVNPQYFEETIELQPGAKRYFTVIKMPSLDKDGTVSGIIGSSLEITELKKTQQDLKEAKERAEAASQAKTDFLENMRHDIRTPLTGIVGFAQIIKEETKDEKIREYADNLAASGQMLLEFLNEILDAVRLTAGELPLRKGKFSLKERLEDIIRLSLPKARVKKLDLALEYDERIPAYLMGDSKRIHRLMLELVSNALNFTDQGKIKISATIAKKFKRSLVLKLEVTDTGIGMPLDRQEEIFTRFKRLTPSYQGIYKGAGLGLSVVKQFIDDLDGEIYLKSEPSKGTTFTCLISFKKALVNDSFGAEIPTLSLVKEPFALTHGALNEEEQQPQIGATTQVLLVEDQFLAAKMAKLILESLHCQVEIAENGKIALEKAANKKYDLIFMDVGLPDLDGCEVTYRLRTAERNSDDHVPILGLTGHIDVENKQRCISAGMDAVLSKPLAKDKAVDLLNAFIPTRSPKRIVIESNIGSTTNNKDLDFVPLPSDVLDLKSAMQLLGGKKDLAIEMLEMLVLSFPEELIPLNQAYANLDMVELESLAHKMKGAACYCGTPRLKEACERLEMYLHKEDKVNTQIVFLFEQLIREINAVQSAYLELSSSK